MITLIVSRACVYRWEPIRDSRSGLRPFRNGSVGVIWPWNWNMQYRLSSYSNMTSGFLVLRHHGGCGWPGSRWTSVHQQPSDWFNHCIVMFPCREINGSLHLHGPYASSQPQYEFQPCDHRTCVSPVSLGRLSLHSTFFFLRCSCNLSGIFICLCLC